MESNQKYTEANKLNQMITEIEELKGIIKKNLNVDVMQRRRQRQNVDARMIYSRILRDRGYTLKFISDSLNKDHTTVIHYLDMSDDIFEQIPMLKDRFDACRIEFLQGKSEMNPPREMMVKAKLEKLDDEIREMASVKQSLIGKEYKYKRLSDIITLIDKRTRPGQERFIEKKINEMFNSIT